VLGILLNSAVHRTLYFQKYANVFQSMRAPSLKTRFRAVVSHCKSTLLDIPFILQESPFDNAARRVVDSMRLWKEDRGRVQPCHDLTSPLLFISCCTFHGLVPLGCSDSE
jgi:hypothetical protein